jgi:hypothetical protein
MLLDSAASRCQSCALPRAQPGGPGPPRCRAGGRKPGWAALRRRRSSIGRGFTPARPRSWAQAVTGGSIGWACPGWLRAPGERGREPGDALSRAAGTGSAVRTTSGCAGGPLPRWPRVRAAGGHRAGACFAAGGPLSCQRAGRPGAARGPRAVLSGPGDESLHSAVAVGVVPAGGAGAGRGAGHREVVRDDLDVGRLVQRPQAGHLDRRAQWPFRSTAANHWA